MGPSYYSGDISDCQFALDLLAYNFDQSIDLDFYYLLIPSSILGGMIIYRKVYGYPVDVPHGASEILGNPIAFGLNGNFEPTVRLKLSPVGNLSDSSIELVSSIDTAKGTLRWGLGFTCSL